MSYYDFYPPYVSIAEKRAKAARQIAKLRKKGKDVSPIEIQGRTIARNWWGKSWCNNLKRYADYSNRIGRGRSYICNGMVLDLQIGKGLVTALVAGTSSNPYEIRIKIDPLPAKAWSAILKKAGGQIESVEKLLEGKFSDEFKELFFQTGNGLFPSPAQIKLGCSCPDWARMCKHVTAALLGVGARLDSQPELFFTLRKLDLTELTAKVVKKHAGKLLRKSKTTSKRSLDMDTGRLESLFGISFDDEAAPPKNRKKRPTTRVKNTNKPIKKKAAKGGAKTTRKALKKRVNKKTTKKAAVKTVKKTVKKAVKKSVKKAVKRAVKKNAKKAAVKRPKRAAKKTVIKRVRTS